MGKRYDLVVVGGGPGGYVAAIRAAQLGLDVALVEKEDVGGVCLNWGCIPTKTLLRSAAVLDAARNAGDYGLVVEDARPDQDLLRQRKESVVERLRSGTEKILSKRGVDIVRGDASVAEPGAVVVSGDGERVDIESGHIILATGSGPLVPSSFPYDGDRVWTSRDALDGLRIPGSIVVIGGGAVGCEFAGFYSSMGTDVTLVEMLDEILPGEDPGAARLLRAAFRKRGVDVRPGTRVEGIEIGDDSVTTTLEGGDEVNTERVLLAMGRRPAIDGAGIPELGLATKDGAVVVDDAMRTSVEGIAAVGDLVGGWLLAHVASREGIVAAERAAGRETTMSYRTVPRVTFTHPEVASVGVTESEARDQGLDISTGRFPFAASGKAVAEGEGTGFVKVIADADDGVLLGGVIAGPGASELVHEIALGVQMRVQAEAVAEMIHAHPTLPEAVMEACEAVDGLSIHSL
ncbi:MAG: dihydrolipoyl dehydrogenase [Candidatus Eisenbacteria bacterium]|nr:dihydrolipoyl dehydrogenase [Candidatus Eisenbacteria bacterium]